MKMFKLLGAFAATATLALASHASAAVPLTFQYYAYGGTYGGLGSPNSFASGGGGTFGPYFNYTANSNQIIYDYLSTTTWSSSSVSLNSGGLYIDNGSLITNPNVNITSVSIDPSSTGLGTFSISNVTWNSSNVAVSWMNQTFGPGAHVVLNINGGGGGGVPEPATWSMMILGFGAAGSLIRRRKAIIAA